MSWSVVSGPTPVADEDGYGWAFVLTNGTHSWETTVYVGFNDPVAKALASQGRSLVAAHLSDDLPPRKIVAGRDIDGNPTIRRSDH